MDYGLYNNERYFDADIMQIRDDVSEEIKIFCKNFYKKSKEELWEKKHNLYFYGEHRTGKSWLLHAIANHLIKTLGEKSVYLISTNKLVSYFFNNKVHTGYEETWINVLAAKKILLLDDLGQDNYTSSEFIPSKMDSFFRYRFNNNKITFVSANFNVLSLEAIYNKSLMKFIEGEFIAINIKGENISKAIKKEALM